VHVLHDHVVYTENENFELSLFKKFKVFILSVNDETCAIIAATLYGAVKYVCDR